LTQDDVRVLALAMDGVVEGAHHGHPDFRVGGVFFLGLSHDGRWANFRTTPANLDAMLAADSLTFRDAWAGRAVGVDLTRVDKATVQPVLQDAYELAAKRTKPGAIVAAKTPAKKRAPLAIDLFEKVREAAHALPGVEVGTCYGTPALRVKKKFLARLREDGESLVIKVGMVERDHLMLSDPRTFFTTDHYRDYPSVLIHLSKVKPAILRDLIEQAWRRTAPKGLLADYEGRRAQ
jgi:hypothetical protein